MKNTLLIYIALFLFSCDNLEPSGDNFSVEKDFMEVKADTMNYSLMIPKFMKKTKNLNDAASLQYQNIFKEVYAIVIDEPAAPFIEQYIELGEYDTTLSVVSNLRSAQLQFIEESGVTFEEDKTKIETTTINGLNAEIVRVEGLFDDLGIYYIFGFVEGKNNIYTVMAWTLTDRKEKYENYLEAIVKSLKELEPDLTEEELLPAVIESVLK